LAGSLKITVAGASSVALAADPGLVVLTGTTEVVAMGTTGVGGPVKIEEAGIFGE